MATIYWLIVFALAFVPVAGVVVSRLITKDGSKGLGRFNNKKVILAAGWAVFALVAGMLFDYGTGVYYDWLWYDAEGIGSKFGTDWKTYTALRVIGTIVYAAFALALISWATVPLMAGVKDSETKQFLLRFLAVFVAAFFAYNVGSNAGSHWFDWLFYSNGARFGKPDPVFGFDLGFYVYELPMINTAVNFAWFALISLGIVTGGLLAAQRFVLRSFEAVDAKLRTLIGFFVAGVCALIGFENLVDRWNLLFSEDGRFYGATALDINVSSPWFMLIAIGWFILAAMAVFASRLKDRFKAGLAFGVPLVLVLAVYPVYWIYSGYYQKSNVSSNEIAMERDFIQRNLDTRRYAFGLDNVKRMEVNPETAKGDSAAIPKDFTDHLRITDFEVFRETAQTLQAIKAFNVFNDADVVAQSVDGKLTQVIWAARELDVDKVPGISASGRRFRFTHGIGAVAGPANGFDAQGQPQLWVNGIPSHSDKLALPKEQRIYFGEKTTEPVIVNTQQGEYDYSKDDGADVENHYDAVTGIQIGGYFRKLAIAFNLDGLFLMNATVVTPESRLLRIRNVGERVSKIAPFLMKDMDAILVPGKENFWFMQNLYTTVNKFPYSSPLKFGDNDIAYIRNSVVSFTNCYTGKVLLVVIDETDPLVRTYRDIYPNLFATVNDLPEELRQFIRYPETLAHFQNEVWDTHHETEPGKFLNNENGWQVSREYHKTLGKEENVADGDKHSRRMTPDHAIWQLPGDSSPAFWLSTPFSPKDVDASHPRDNLTGILAMRFAEGFKPEIAEVRLPDNSQFFGPRQVGGYLNQDSILSQRFTLWDQKGSRIVFGDCVTVPLIDGRIFYAQPVFLKASGMRMPALQFVGVSLGEGIDWAPTYEQAVEKLRNRGSGNVQNPQVQSVAGSPQTKQVTTTPSSSGNPFAEINGLFDQYNQLNSQGKYSEAGAVLQQIQAKVSSQAKQ